MTIIRGDVFKFIQMTHTQYDYIFAGPPYPLANIQEIPNLIFANKLVRPNGWFVLEHNHKHDFQKHPQFSQVRNYGKTIFSIFVNREEQLK